jgi:hypothetical protein
VADDDGCGGGGGVQQPAFDGGDAQGAEVAGCDEADVEQRRGLAGRGRELPDDRPGQSPSAGERQAVDGAGGGHAGDGLEPVDEPVVESGNLFGAVEPVGVAEVERQQVVRAEAGVDCGQAPEAAHQQPGAHEQDEGEGHLRDNEGVAGPVSFPARRRASIIGRTSHPRTC